MHYEPETLTSSRFEPDKRHKFEKNLMGKFEQNLLMKHTGNPYYPDKCLGHGCAKWSVSKSIEFADEFFGKMGLKPMYNHVKENLNI